EAYEITNAQVKFILENTNIQAESILKDDEIEEVVKEINILLFDATTLNNILISNNTLGNILLIVLAEVLSNILLDTSAEASSHVSLLQLSLATIQSSLPSVDTKAILCICLEEVNQQCLIKKSTKRHRPEVEPVGFPQSVQVNQNISYIQMTSSNKNINQVFVKVSSLAEAKTIYQEVEQALINVVKAGIYYKKPKEGKFMQSYKERIIKLCQAEDPEEYILKLAKTIFPNEEKYHKIKDDYKEFYR
ncbi:23328_t:CDS:2, partial [Cetraspora pellucida]